MSSQAVLRIFVSSPGDVGEERYLAARAIERLRAEWAGRVALEALFWENEALPATGSFQEELPLPSTFDVVVCILWSRLGTRLPADVTRPDGSRYESGTEFELEDATRGFRETGRPHLLVYRKDHTMELGGRDRRRADDERWLQKKALDAFLDRWFHDDDGSLKAAFHSFPGPAVFEEHLERHLRQLIERHWQAHGGEVAGAGRPLWTDGSPFRGLRSFRTEHAAIYCGRTAHVTAVLDVLRHQALAGDPFVLVVGRSGSGKSSLLRAGVLPTLTEAGVIEGIVGWRRAELVPGRGGGDLLRGLAQALLAPGALEELRGDETDEEELTALLRTRPKEALPLVRAGLSRAAEAIRHDRGLNVVPKVRLALLIDPLDELFSDQRFLEDERTAFATALAALVNSGLVWGLAALRSDFHGRFAELAALSDLRAAEARYELGPPTASELARIVRQPARLAGLSYETDPATGRPLSDVLCDEAAANPDSLPLLGFTLDQLYERRSPEGLLTYAAYRDLGGVEGALARRAEEVFRELDPDVQSALGGVFTTLAAHGEEDDPTLVQRRAPLDEVEGAAQGAGALVDAFVRERLLVVDRAAGGTAVLWVANAALLTHWPRVAECLRDNEDVLRVQGQLRAAAALRRQHPEYVLPPGPLLDEAGALTAAGRLRPGRVEEELLRASRAAAADAEQRRRQARLTVAAAIALLVIAGVLALYLYVFEHTSYYSGFVKRWGVPEGVGPLDRDDVRRREWSLRFERRGRRGRVERVVAVSADDRPTPKHQVNRYISSWRDDPEFADRECSWEFVYDSDGRVARERSINCAGQPTVVLLYKDSADRRQLMAEYSKRGIAAAQSDSGASLVRITRDENGYERELRYFDAGGVPATTDDKVFGLRFEGLAATDGDEPKREGLPARLVYLDRRGEPATGPEGCAQLDLRWDERDQQTGMTCLDAAGRPTRTQLGLEFTRVTFGYDPDGNWNELEFQDRIGQPLAALPRVERRFDWDERTVVTTYRSLDGEPVVLPDLGYSELRQKTTLEDDETVVEETYLTAGRPTPDLRGVTRRRYRFGKTGILREETHFGDEDEETLIRDADGVMAIERQVEDGRGFRQVFRDGEGNATRGAEGYATVERIHDQNGRLLEEAFRDAAGNLVCNARSFARRSVEYDDRGLPTEVRYHDHRNSLTEMVDGYAREVCSFGVGGLPARKEYFDDAGNRVPGPEGHPVVLYEYDDAARVRQMTFHDADDVLADGRVAYQRQTWNEVGQPTEKRSLDRRQQPVESVRVRYGPGQAWERSFHGPDGRLVGFTTRYEVDALGRTRAMAFLDARGDPTHRGDGVARLEFEYDLRGRMVRESLRGEDRELVTGAQGYAILDLEYDRWGRPVGQRLFTADETPPDDRPTEIRQTFDPWGRPLQVRFLDRDERPVSGLDDCPGAELAYDVRGFPTELLCRDGAGRPRRGLAGHAGVRILRNDCGRPFALRFLDETGRRMAEIDPLPAEIVASLWGGWNHRAGNPDLAPLPADTMAASFLRVLHATQGGRSAPRPVPRTRPPGPQTSGTRAAPSGEPGGNRQVTPPTDPPFPPPAEGHLDDLTQRLSTVSERLLDAYERQVEADDEETPQEERLYALLERFHEHADELRAAHKRSTGQDVLSRLRGRPANVDKKIARMRSEMRILQGLRRDIAGQAGSFHPATAGAWRDADATLQGIAARMP